MSFRILPVLVFLFACVGTTDAAPTAKDAGVIRAGIIGLDTSHCLAFTKTFNNPDGKGDIAGVRIVAAFPGGSPDIPSSRDRIEQFTKQVRGMGVEIVGSIPE